MCFWIMQTTIRGHMSSGILCSNDGNEGSGWRGGVVGLALLFSPHFQGRISEFTQNVSEY